jgi:glycosyltransferase involved in cell wall biosynthesis
MPKLLVLDQYFSGINPFLFNKLKAKGWDVVVEDIPMPKILKYAAILSTVQFNRVKWRNSAEQKLGKLNKTKNTFLARSRFCGNVLGRHKTGIDAVLQIAGMFMPGMSPELLNVPYVIFTDYTMKLSEKYPQWMPAKSEVNGWIECEMKAYHSAAIIFVLSKNTKKSLIKDYGINEEKIIVTSIAPEIKGRFNEAKYENKNILFVGKDFERKGGYVLLEAFKLIEKKFPDSKLLIAGPKALPKNLGGNVEFYGKVDRGVVEGLFDDASVFVMPSLCEPFGYAFLEAMSFGLPCVGTTIDAMPEIIEDGVTGYCVRPNDPDSLAEKIGRLLSDEKLKKEMGLNAYTSVTNKFSWDSAIKTIDETLRNLIH